MAQPGSEAGLTSNVGTFGLTDLVSRADSVDIGCSVVMTVSTSDMWDEDGHEDSVQPQRDFSGLVETFVPLKSCKSYLTEFKGN